MNHVNYLKWPITQPCWNKLPFPFKLHLCLVCKFRLNVNRVFVLVHANPFGKGGSPLSLFVNMVLPDNTLERYTITDFKILIWHTHIEIEWIQVRSYLQYTKMVLNFAEMKSIRAAANQSMVDRRRVWEWKENKFKLTGKSETIGGG